MILRSHWQKHDDSILLCIYWICVISSSGFGVWECSCQKQVKWSSWFQAALNPCAPDTCSGCQSILKPYGCFWSLSSSCFHTDIHRFLVPRCTTKYGKNSFVLAAVTLMNNLWHLHLSLWSFLFHLVQLNAFVYFIRYPLEHSTSVEVKLISTGGFFYFYWFILYFFYLIYSLTWFYCCLFWLYGCLWIRFVLSTLQANLLMGTKAT